MGRMEKGKDGRIVFKGGFSLKNKDDLEQLISLIFKKSKKKVGEKKKEKPKTIKDKISNLLKPKTQKGKTKKPHKK